MAKIGNLIGFSEVLLGLDEEHGNLFRLREETTCSNIDNALAKISEAMEEIELYFDWAKKMEDERLRRENEGESEALGDV